MKKLLIIFLVGMFSGCTLTDWSGYSFYVFENDSDYTVILSGGRSYYSLLENEAIQPGKSLEKEDVGMASYPAPRESFHEIAVDFGNGVKVVYGYSEELNPEVYDRKYDPRWTENYVRETVDKPHGCKKCPGARWTYTFTNADYEAAKALSEGKEDM